METLKSIEAQKKKRRQLKAITEQWR